MLSHMIAPRYVGINMGALPLPAPTQCFLDRKGVTGKGGEISTKLTRSKSLMHSNDHVKG